MAGIKSKTREEVVAILSGEGVDVSTLSREHPDWNDSITIIQTLVNGRKLFVSDLQKIHVMDWPVKPAPKNVSKPSASEDRVKAQAIMIRLLKERNSSLYDELRLAVVDEMLPMKREEMANKLGL